MGQIDDLRELRERAWKYFVLHADQRLRTFNFYILMAAILLGGLFNLLKESSGRRQGALISLALAFFSFVFWKLDARNRELVHNAEAVLLKIEVISKDTPELHLFLPQEHRDLQARGVWNALTGSMPFSASFNLVFFVVGTSSLVLAVYLLIS